MTYQRYKPPPLDVPWTMTDRLVMAAGALGMFVLVALPLFAWSGLPDQVPIHFGVSGDPDRWAGRESIWFLPALGLVMFIGMCVLTRYPHAYNYPVTLTDENAPHLYRLSRSMVIWLNAEVTLLFAFIEWTMLRTATGDVDGLGILFLPAYIAIIFATIGYFMYRSFKVR